MGQPQDNLPTYLTQIFCQNISTKISWPNILPKYCDQNISPKYFNKISQPKYLGQIFCQNISTKISHPNILPKYLNQNILPKYFANSRLDWLIMKGRRKVCWFISGSMAGPFAKYLSQESILPKYLVCIFCQNIWSKYCCQNIWTRYFSIHVWKVFCQNIQVSGQMARLQYHKECDEYIQIFTYSNIFVTHLYSDIRWHIFFFYRYIWTFDCVKFVCTNIFGHSCVSVKTRGIFEYACNFQYGYSFV